MLKIIDVNENPYSGIFVSACESIVLVPTVITSEIITELETVFRVPVLRTSIGNTTLIGSLLAMNSHGAVVSNIINNTEFRKLAKEMNIVVLKERNNALGNIILASEDKALISPHISARSERKIGDVLDVETMRGTIAEQDNVGMAAVVTTNGLLCHPKITPEEKEIIDDFYGMESNIGTKNFGMPLEGAGVAANSNGAIVGSKTTGVELNRIENTLDLI